MRGEKKRTGSNFEGTFTHMARMVFDPESRRTWVSYLKVDLDAHEIETEWGPTRVTTANDAVMVKFKSGAVGYSSPVFVNY